MSSNNMDDQDDDFLAAALEMSLSQVSKGVGILEDKSSRLAGGKVGDAAMSADEIGEKGTRNLDGKEGDLRKPTKNCVRSRRVPKSSLACTPTKKQKKGQASGKVAKSKEPAGDGWEVVDLELPPHAMMEDADQWAKVSEGIYAKRPSVPSVPLGISLTDGKSLRDKKSSEVLRSASSKSALVARGKAPGRRGKSADKTHVRCPTCKAPIKYVDEDLEDHWLLCKNVDFNALPHCRFQRKCRSVFQMHYQRFSHFSFTHANRVPDDRPKGSLPPPPPRPPLPGPAGKFSKAGREKPPAPVNPFSSTAWRKMLLEEGLEEDDPNSIINSCNTAWANQHRRGGQDLQFKTAERLHLLITDIFVGKDQATATLQVHSSNKNRMVL